MKLLFFSDLHAHNWSQFHTRMPNGLNSRLNDCVDIIRQAAGVVKQYDIDHVLFLGDLFESRKSLDIDVYSEVFRAVKDLAAVVPQRVWMLKGNHDCHTKIGDVHSLSAFAEIQGVELIQDPWVCLPMGGASIAAFPYMADVGELKRHLSALSSVDLVLLHQSIREGSIGPYNHHIAAELSLTDLPMDSCRYVFAGDYHKRQFFGPGNRVHYIGSPLQLNATEAGEEKGFTMVDTDGWNLYTIPTVFPKFHLFDSPEAAEAVISAEQGSPVDTGKDFVRIKYTDDSRAKAETLKSTFERLQIEEVKVTKVNTRTESAVVENDYDLLTEYVTQRGEKNVEALVSLGLSLLETE